MSSIDRSNAERDKTGVDTGRTITNPVNGQQIPVWVADYVLPDYGEGALMAVPAHDERDHAFAKQFGLPIVQVVEPPAGADVDRAAIAAGDLAWAPKEGTLLNSAGTNADYSINGMDPVSGAEQLVSKLAADGVGEATINYRLRDWLISRQRYRGCPIPIIHCDSCGMVPVPDAQLPVLLPDVQDFQPKGKSPLAASDEFVNVSCPTCCRSR